MRIGVYFTHIVLAIAVPAFAETIGVGDGLLQVRLTTGDRGPRESGIVVAGRELTGVTGTPWSVQVDGTQCEVGDGSVRAPAALSRSAAEAEFSGEGERFSWRLTYAATGPGRITKTLTLTSKREQRLERVALWNAVGKTEPVVVRTTLQDITAFYRAGDRGLFVSLDSPYSNISVEGGRTTVGFPPFVQLKAGQVFACHSLTLGATQLSGRHRHGFDEGEIDAVDRYVQERFRPRFERPMILSASLVNRYTQVRGDVVFYTMKDHPTLCDKTDLLERELALMPKLGVEYYQVFPGVFDWAPGDPQPDEVSRLMQVAQSHGVRMGDYSGTSSVFCAHYNEHRNRLDHPEWMIQGEDHKPIGTFCFGCPEFADYYARTVAENCRKYRFELQCLDFLALAPCYAEGHGHPVGRDSLYRQVSGLVGVLQAINNVSPEMMTWSNSGNWAELLPKLAWYNPNLYLTDPFIATPWQGLNMTRLLDDARREQMVSLHNTRFIPYRFLTNCQYFFSQNSVVPDIRNYEYGALSTLAVTPNLCLAEIRPWLDRMPSGDRDRVLAFYTKWTGFIRQHFDLWKRTFQAGDNPGPGAVEIYSHARGSHGFVFVVNPQYWSRTVEVPVDASLGFDGAGRCEVRELYPVERLRLTPEGTTVAIGSRLPVEVPAQQVIVLELRSPEPVSEPRLYGLPGTVERKPGGCLVRTHGPQGHTARFAVVVPEDGVLPIGASVRTDTPRRPARYADPTTLKVLGTDGTTLLMDLTFRRDPAPTELRDWSVRQGSLDEGTKAAWPKGFSGGTRARFPLLADVNEPEMTMPLSDADADRLKLGPLATFCGAYVENAFSEEQETWIDVTTAPNGGAASTRPAGTEQFPRRAALSELARDPGREWWLQTTFNLPFMYTMGAEPPFDEHTFLVLPLLMPARVKSVQAWINGIPLDVRLYCYPRNPGLTCRYADLVGSGVAGGQCTLVVHLGY